MAKDKAKMTNREFASTDTQFREACSKAGVDATKRQAGKWRRQTGRAYKEAHGIKIC